MKVYFVPSNNMPTNEAAGSWAYLGLVAIIGLAWFCL